MRPSRPSKSSTTNNLEEAGRSCSPIRPDELHIAMDDAQQLAHVVDDA
jgi:hypothetical protein